MRESESPHCRRLFCIQCQAPWHSGMECQEFQRLNADERGGFILLKKLAEEKKWMRCPKCKFYVEKTEGCVQMRCRWYVSRIVAHTGRHQGELKQEFGLYWYLMLNHLH